MNAEDATRTNVEYVGPFEHHEVVVDGWRVPYLTVTPLPGGRLDFCLDNRFGVDMTLQEGERLVPFIAHCMAVAAGYTAHPGEGLDAPLPRHPMVRMHGVYLDNERQEPQ